MWQAIIGDLIEQQVLPLKFDCLKVPGMKFQVASSMQTSNIYLVQRVQLKDEKARNMRIRICKSTSAQFWQGASLLGRLI
jgi:hypothetical protein